MIINNKGGNNMTEIISVEEYAKMTDEEKIEYF